jgi:hypothetical protein
MRRKRGRKRKYIKKDEEKKRLKKIWKNFNQRNFGETISKIANSCEKKYLKKDLFNNFFKFNNLSIINFQNFIIIRNCI